MKLDNKVILDLDEYKSINEELEYLRQIKYSKTAFVIASTYDSLIKVLTEEEAVKEIIKNYRGQIQDIHRIYKEKEENYFEKYNKVYSLNLWQLIKWYFNKGK